MRFPGRITSYNVCYTKLLRIPGRGSPGGTRIHAALQHLPGFPRLRGRGGHPRFQENRDLRRPACGERGGAEPGKASPPGILPAEQARFSGGDPNGHRGEESTPGCGSRIGFRRTPSRDRASLGNEEGTFPVRARDIPISLLRGYQRLVSPYLGDCCRFYPSCSEYTIGSLRMNGTLVGILAGLWRILRCHPFHPGGVDEPRRIQIFGTRYRWKNG